MVAVLRRWLLPAALSAFAGIALAVWMHPLSGTPVAPHRIDAPEPHAAAPPASHPPTRGIAADDVPAGADLQIPAITRPEQLEALRQALLRHQGTDVALALAPLLALDAAQRRYLAEDVLREAARRAPAVTIEWVESHFANSAERESLLMAAYTGIAADDPSFALGAVQQLTDGGLRRTGTQQVLEVWARHDPPAAYEWVRARTGEGAEELYVTVMDAYIEALPQQAGELIATLPPGGARARLIDRYAFDIAASDPAGAAEWLTRFDPDVSTQRAFMSVYDQWAEQDPWAAIDHAAVEFDGELGAELIGRVAASMGTTRPRALAASLDRVPEPYRGLAAHRLAHAWEANDPIAARGWVRSLPAELEADARRGLAASRHGG